MEDTETLRRRVVLPRWAEVSSVVVAFAATAAGVLLRFAPIGGPWETARFGSSASASSSSSPRP